LVLEKTLAGPLNLLVKFSTLQEYGVDKPFFLENGNVDTSQRNIVFLVRGDKAKTVITVAGMLCVFTRSIPRLLVILWDLKKMLGRQSLLCSVKSRSQHEMK